MDVVLSFDWKSELAEIMRLLPLTLILIAGVRGQTNDVLAPAVRATLCDLAERPEQYVGKMVKVRASVAGNDLWVDDFEQKPACSSWMGVIIALPDQIKPRADLEVVRDDAFSHLFTDLRKGMNVQATFEAVYTWRNQKQVWISENPEKRKGFGKKGQYGGRIVLHQVSDLLARHLPRK